MEGEGSGNGGCKAVSRPGTSVSKHVLTTIRIEDEDGANDKLITNVASVERAAGRKLQREVLVKSE